MRIIGYYSIGYVDLPSPLISACDSLVTKFDRCLKFMLQKYTVENQILISLYMYFVYCLGLREKVR